MNNSLLTIFPSTVSLVGVIRAKDWGLSVVLIQQLLLNDTHATLLDGAIALWPDLENKIAYAMMESLLVGLQIDAGSRFVDLRAATRRKILHGTGEQWFEVQVPGKGKKAGPRFKFQFKGSTLLSLKPLVCRRRSEQNWNIW